MAENPSKKTLRQTQRKSKISFYYLVYSAPDSCLPALFEGQLPDNTRDVEMLALPSDDPYQWTQLKV